MNELTSGLHVMAVDNHYLVRRGIEEVLKEIPCIAKTFMARSGEDALNYMESFKPNLVLMDYSMPGMMGDACTRTMKEKYPAVKVIALSGHTDGPAIMALLGSGIDGFLFKNAGSKEIEDALRSAMTGHFYSSPEVAPAIADISVTATKNTRLQMDALNSEEKRVMCMIFREITNKKISTSLSITEKKVEGIRKKLFDNAQTDNAVGFTKWIMHNGWEGYCEMN